MQPSATGKPADLARARSPKTGFASSLNRKIWLPRLLYEVVPWFYLGAGILAFFATLYISDWFWILPHYLLFSAACLHLGLGVLMRRRNRNQGHDSD
jgi:hypothetical protein